MENYPESYLQYLVEFHGSRDYFECHELLEEEWKKDPPGERKQYWMGLIQLAVSLYHQRRGNYNGAKRMLSKANNTLHGQQQELELLGIDAKALLVLVHKRLEEINQNAPYYSFSLPLHDNDLLSNCMKKSLTNGYSWGAESDLENISLIHRHKLRDRTDVIEERLRKLADKRDNNHIVDQ